MPELHTLHVHGESIGYGRMGMNLVRALRRKGVACHDVVPEPGEEGHKAKVALWFSVPTHARGWWKGQSPRIATMWEFTRLPESFRCTLHNFDQVIVPSFQNIELFGQYHDNVAYVPLGHDPDVWHYVPRQKPEVEFRFLIGGSGPRKGGDLVYKAFKALWGKEGSWGDGPIPTLIFKSPRGWEQGEGQPRVSCIGGRISPQEEVDLYAYAHCYLQPSRGEGWGLQPHQAIAQGLPTILTNAHGHESFAHLGWGLKTKLVPAGYSIYGDAGEWWEPDFDELCDRMKWVYENYDQAEADAARNAEAMKEFTWEKSAEKLLAVLGDLDQPFASDEWYVPDEVLYPVIVTRPWKADIAGRVHLFEPGRTYYHPADVQRILFEAGLLDPVCLKQDHGLLASQVERIPDYSAAMGHCPTCGQGLGTKVTRADALYAEMA